MRRRPSWERNTLVYHVCRSSVAHSWSMTCAGLSWSIIRGPSRAQVMIRRPFSQDPSGWPVHHDCFTVNKYVHQQLCQSAKARPTCKRKYSRSCPATCVGLFSRWSYLLTNKARKRICTACCVSLMQLTCVIIAAQRQGRGSEAFDNNTGK